MLNWKPRPSPLPHAYAYIREKISAEDVERRLATRPTTRRLDLQAEAIQSNLKSAVRDTVLLFAADCFDELIGARDRRGRELITMGSDVLIAECILFAASGSVAYLNPSSDTWDAFTSVQYELVDLLDWLTLIPQGALAELSEIRVEQYATRTDNPEGLIAHTFGGALEEKLRSGSVKSSPLNGETPVDLTLLLRTSDLARRLERVTGRLVDEFVKVEMEADDW
jgi:hypothetical protein